MGYIPRLLDAISCFQTPQSQRPPPLPHVSIPGNVGVSQRAPTNVVCWVCVHVGRSWPERTGGPQPGPIGENHFRGPHKNPCATASAQLWLRIRLSGLRTGAAPSSSLPVSTLRLVLKADSRRMGWGFPSVVSVVCLHNGKLVRTGAKRGSPIVAFSLLARRAPRAVSGVSRARRDTGRSSWLLLVCPVSFIQYILRSTEAIRTRNNGAVVFPQGETVELTLATPNPYIDEWSQHLPRGLRAEGEAFYRWGEQGSFFDPQSRSPDQRSADDWGDVTSHACRTCTMYSARPRPRLLYPVWNGAQF